MKNILQKDSIFSITKNNNLHVISENYSYKTEAYYLILKREEENIQVNPSTNAILDAYVIPVCLEKAASHGIPVCPWGLSQGYIPTPSIVYGLNYFSDSSEFTIVYDQNKTKSLRDHITNYGKYIFCYQKFDTGTTVHSCIAIFGETFNKDLSEFAQQIYDVFKLPLMTIIYTKNHNKYLLSSIGQTTYFKLSKDEKKLLKQYIQEGIS